MALFDKINPASIQLKLIILLGSILLLITTHVVVGYVWYEKGINSSDRKILTETVKQLETHQADLAKQQNEFNKSVEDLNKKLDSHTQTVKIINTNTEHEIAKIVYRDTLVPDTGMQLLADNASALNAKRVPIGGTNKVQNVKPPTDK